MVSYYVPLCVALDTSAQAPNTHTHTKYSGCMDLDESFEAMLQHAKVAFGHPHSTRGLAGTSRKLSPRLEGNDTLLAAELMQQDDIQEWVNRHKSGPHRGIPPPRVETSPMRRDLSPSPQVLQTVPIKTHQRQHLPSVVQRVDVDELFRHHARVSDATPAHRGEVCLARQPAASVARGWSVGDRVSGFRNEMAVPQAVLDENSDWRVVPLSSVAPQLQFPPADQPRKADVSHTSPGVLSLSAPPNDINSLPAVFVLDNLHPPAAPLQHAAADAAASSTSAVKSPTHPSGGPYSLSLTHAKPLPAIPDDNSFKDVHLHFISPSSHGGTSQHVAAAATSNVGPQQSANVESAEVAVKSEPAVATSAAHNAEETATQTDPAEQQTAITSSSHAARREGEHSVLESTAPFVDPSTLLAVRQQSQPAASRQPASARIVASSMFQSDDDGIVLQSRVYRADDRDPDFVAAMHHESTTGRSGSILSAPEFRRLLVGGSWLPAPAELQTGPQLEIGVAVQSHRSEPAAASHSSAPGAAPSNNVTAAPKTYASFTEEFPAPPQPQPKVGTRRWCCS